MVASLSSVQLLLAAGIAAMLGLAVAGCRPQHSGPNDAYLDPRVSAEDWNRLLTTPGRELYDKRETVVRLADVKPGMEVADVGAGTGLFAMMLSDAVGSGGHVYAEEVIGKFSRYIAAPAARQGRTNVVSVVGTETSIGLPPESIDLAFLCDVFHHFDHPHEMLASIHRALRADGKVFLVEFRREPASPAWVFDHVRAAEAQVTREFEQAGFVRLWKDDSLHDSYVARFGRSEATQPVTSASGLPRSVER
jgi:ubiquinone/menaquinone biosynthesis C-methylase UbiE